MSPENEKSRPGTRATGKSKASGSPSLRQAVDRRAAGIAEAEQPRALVERLAGRVVERRAEHVEPGVILDVEEERVAAACEQAEEGRLDRVGLEKERRDVAVQVIDRRQREPQRPRQRLRRGEPDEERPDQPGPARDRDALDVRQLGARLAERLAEDRRHELEVPARRDLGDDAAVAGVQVGLRRDDVGADLAVVGDESRGGLVTRRLEPEDQALAGSRTGSFHMISASSRLSV